MTQLYRDRASQCCNLHRQVLWMQYWTSAYFSETYSQEFKAVLRNLHRVLAHCMQESCLVWRKCHVLAGRSSERPVLSEEEINSNVEGIRGTLEHLLQPEGDSLKPPWITNNLVSSPKCVKSTAVCKSRQKRKCLFPSCRSLVSCVRSFSLPINSTSHKPCRIGLRAWVSWLFLERWASMRGWMSCWVANLFGNV